MSTASGLDEGRFDFDRRLEALSWPHEESVVGSGGSIENATVISDARESTNPKPNGSEDWSCLPDSEVYSRNIWRT